MPDNIYDDGWSVNVKSLFSWNFEECKMTRLGNPINT
jgi:hypothetical protein